MCEREFGVSGKRRLEAHRIKPPDVVCVGLSSRHTILALKSAPTEEGSAWIPKDKRVQELGGQHLIPALELARRGRRVALVTRFGHDDDGDAVLREVQEILDRSSGDLDLQTVPALEDHDRATRHTVVVTYRNRDRYGVRTNYDWEGVSSTRAWHGPLNVETRAKIRRLVKRYRGARAIYLGPISVELNASVLKVLRDAKWRLLETSTDGGPQASWDALIEQARACTHVLASAKFISRLLAGGRLGLVRESGAFYQEQLAEEPNNLVTAHNKLFENRRNRVIVATLGAAGAAFVRSGDTSPTLVPVPRPPNPKRQFVWIGCGDLFRGVLIDRLIAGDELLAAVRKANEAAAKRTTRLPMFE